MTHAEQVARDERALADAALAFLAAECSHGPERKALELAGARVRASRNRSDSEPRGLGADALSCWFGLSYANYLTVPRALLEAMPDEWQGRAARLLNEITEEFRWPLESDHEIEVRLRDRSTRKWVSDPLAEYRRPDFVALAKARRRQ